MMMAELEQEIRSEFPNFEISPKSGSWLMKVIDAFLKIISFWQMNVFMTRSVTTIGNRVYVPDSWNSRIEVQKIVTLRHERVHMRQRRKYGSLLFSFLYLFFPLPLLLAYYRRKFEMEAYEESMRALVEYYGIRVLEIPSNRERFIAHFTTAEYLWMWPFRKLVERWYDSMVGTL